MARGESATRAETKWRMQVQKGDNDEISHSGRRALPSPAGLRDPTSRAGLPHRPSQVGRVRSRLRPLGDHTVRENARTVRVRSELETVPEWKHPAELSVMEALYSVPRSVADPCFDKNGVTIYAGDTSKSRLRGLVSMFYSSKGLGSRDG